MWIPKDAEGGAYLRLSAFQRKYGDHCYGQVESVILDGIQTKRTITLITKPRQTRLFTLSSWFVQIWYLGKNKCPNFIKIWLVLATMLESLAEFLTELCAFDFYRIYFSFRLSLIFQLRYLFPAFFQVLFQADENPPAQIFSEQLSKLII